MNLRVTSILDEVLVFENISLDLNQDYDTQLRFSTPPECIQTLSTVDLLKPTTVFYPNPTSGILHLQNNTKKWILNDANGKIIDQGTASSIQMAALAPGMYFITLENKQTQKIIKQ